MEDPAVLSLLEQIRDGVGALPHELARLLSRNDPAETLRRSPDDPGGPGGGGGGRDDCCCPCPDRGGGMGSSALPPGLQTQGTGLLQLINEIGGAIWAIRNIREVLRGDWWGGGGDGNGGGSGSTPRHVPPGPTPPEGAGRLTQLAPPGRQTQVAPPAPATQWDADASGHAGTVVDPNGPRGGRKTWAATQVNGAAAAQAAQPKTVLDRPEPTSLDPSEVQLIEEVVTQLLEEAEAGGTPGRPTQLRGDAPDEQRHRGAGDPFPSSAPRTSLRGGRTALASSPEMQAQMRKRNALGQFAPEGPPLPRPEPPTDAETPPGQSATPQASAAQPLPLDLAQVARDLENAQAVLDVVSPMRGLAGVLDGLRGAASGKGLADGIDRLQKSVDALRETMETLADAQQPSAEREGAEEVKTGGAEGGGQATRQEARQEGGMAAQVVKALKKLTASSATPRGDLVPPTKRGDFDVDKAIQGAIEAGEV